MSDADAPFDVAHRLSSLVDRLEQAGRLERPSPRVLRAFIAAAAYDWSRFQADRYGPPRESNAHAQLAHDSIGEAAMRVQMMRGEFTGRAFECDQDLITLDALHEELEQLYMQM